MLNGASLTLPAGPFVRVAVDATFTVPAGSLTGSFFFQKQGTTVLYALADPRIATLLKVAREILNHRLTGSKTGARG